MVWGIFWLPLFSEFWSNVAKCQMWFIGETIVTVELKIVKLRKSSSAVEQSLEEEKNT